MKKVNLFLTTLVLAALLLAACGAEPTPTSVPNTSAPPATVEVEATSTSESTATEAPTSTSEANTATTPGIPVTGEGKPSQSITSLIGTPVCGLGGDQLGTVKDVVLDFGQMGVTYMIVDANGKAVAVPYSFLSHPKTEGTGTGTGTGAQATDTPSAGGSGTGTLATDTPSASGTTATDTPSAGTGTTATDTPSASSAVSTATSTTGTGTGSAGTGTTTQQNCLTLTVGNDVFNSVPAFDETVMPGLGQSSQDWDTAIMPYWVGGVEDIATNTPAPTSTPAAAVATTATATTSASSSGTGTESGSQSVQQIIGVALATDLLGANVFLTPQAASAGAGTGTGNALSTSTPSAGGTTATDTPSAGTGTTATDTPSVGTSSTASPDTTATASSGGTGSGTGTGSTITDSSQGTVLDVIIEPRIGKLQYLVVSFDSGGTWIPVPFSAVGWDSTSNQIILMVSADMLQNAPSFPSGQLPDTSTAGWDQQFSTYWSGGGTGTGPGTGSGGTTSATATATP